LRIKQNIPNAITCGNLLCGCLAIINIFEGNLVWAAYLVGIAAILDFFDGFVARLLGVSSPIGKDLDSLADMVTFGVVPGLIIFQLIKTAVKFSNFEGCVGCESPGHFIEPGQFETYLPFFALMIPVFSAIRLAKFNNDPRQSDSFIGLPTPANAILMASLTLPLEFGNHLDGSLYPTGESILILNTYFLLFMTFLFSFLLVAELPLFALKFRQFGWKGNEIRYVFLGLSLVLLVSLQVLGIPLVIILYILLSIINNRIVRRKA
jgi:CDP-diacylglycerol---serine O-phosphatidyltransferase